MRKMTSNEIRSLWIKYFEEHGHKYVESAPLIPRDDDSLLWINAGVTPLKKYFDGTVIPESRRIVNIQKCIRTNDIENVGVTRRHHTFFEMMGNFSIGDYFKNEAISFAFELLTSDKWFAIPKDRLYVTVYTDDADALNKWIELGMDPSHMIKLDENFWEIGSGPCGPDSEIFFDRGEKYDPNHDAFEKFKNDDEQERYIEIWNNVFSQFQSEEGKPREKYKELPHKNIDTGAGLERWCTIFQDVDSSFETDLFTPILAKIEEMSGILYNGQTSFKVIADHIKAITFALSDGASFGNTGRDYVLRRLLRRSSRFGKQLGFNEPFLYKLVGTVCETMGDFYKELYEKRAEVEALILEEEKLFLKTLEQGMAKLDDILETVTDGVVSGYDAFKLYDTFGFPLELTEEIATEKGYNVDKDGFVDYMNKQRETAKKSNRNKTSMAKQKQVLMDFKKPSSFVYGLYRLKSSVLAIFSKDNLEKELVHDGYIALKRTCFYAESGGQVADTGMITSKNFTARVVDVFKGPNGQHIHKIKLLSGKITTGDECEVIIDKERRHNIESNHSSVHMLQYALQTIVSPKIMQAGSYVDDSKLRFDFTYTGKIFDEQLYQAEDMVNEMIDRGIITSTEVMPLDKAKELGAMALFGEKYGETVRVVKIDKSMELCGGTHIANTKDIKRFAISSFESKGSNTYRIEACTNKKIETTLFELIKPYNDEMVKLLMKSKEILEQAKKLDINLTFDVTIDNSAPKSYRDIVFNRNELSYVQGEVKTLERKFQEEKEKQSLNKIDEYLTNLKVINDKNFLYLTFNNEEMDILKAIMDALANRIDSSLVFIVNIKEDNSVNFICRNKIASLSAGYLVKQIASISNGNGGGSATFAQGGGKTREKLDEVYKYLVEQINEAA